jgi:uracil-DNA glycosylase family 4
MKDSRIVIKLEDQKKLFTSLRHLDSSNKKLYAGTCLGLAISRELVKSMNGEIGVVSPPGLGSTFWFTFKAYKANNGQTIDSEDKPNIIREFVGEKPKILLVDDNDINRMVATEILRKSGCEVLTADSGLSALHLVKEHEFDLVFMDIQMPEMDGVEATKLIKKLGLNVTPPIIAMTAYSMEEDKAKFISQGMDDYLAKPIQSNLRRKIVFGVGAEDAPLMFIGEAPGEQEDRRGEPFVGPAGELLDRMIEAMGWTRDTVYIANALKCRPPQNRNPQPDELAPCTPFLDAQIRAIAPRIIVTLGRPAANHVLGRDAPISALRGQFHDRGGVKVMPTFHPAYLLREPDRKKDTWSDLKQVIAELERLGIQPPRPPRG